MDSIKIIFTSCLSYGLYTFKQQSSFERSSKFLASVLGKWNQLYHRYAFKLFWLGVWVSLSPIFHNTSDHLLNQKHKKIHVRSISNVCFNGGKLNLQSIITLNIKHILYDVFFLIWKLVYPKYFDLWSCILYEVHCMISELAIVITIDIYTLNICRSMWTMNYIIDTDNGNK